MKIALLPATELTTLLKTGETPNRAALLYILPFLEGQSEQLIRNVRAEVRLLRINDFLLPLVLGNENRQHNNSYVCSPMAHYVHYAKIELDVEMPDKKWLKRLAIPIFNALGALGQWCQFEQVLYVNNWLVSTNLYPSLSVAELEAIKHFLLQTFPDRTLVFRSVNTQLNKSVFDTLQKTGFKPVMSRQVYITDPKSWNFRRNSNYKKDIKLWQRQPHYEWEALSEKPNREESERILALYSQLYIKKYSPFNPDLSLAYFYHTLESGFLTYHVLRNRQENGRTDAVVGYYSREGVMTTPFAGYDLDLPLETGLYRLLTLKITEESEKQGLILNRSSGAARYKRLRGAEPVMEYNMVYNAHLPLRRRLIWRLFRFISDYIAIPLMRRMGL